MRRTSSASARRATTKSTRRRCRRSVGGGDRDLSDYVAKYDEYVTSLIRKRQAAQSVMIEVSSAIETLEVEEEKQVLLYRYIHLMRWEEIADAMHIALRTAFYWHGQALAHFKIPDCIDMQSPSR